MMGKLSGKTALITGASKGIGEGIARVYAREGANLVLCARGSQTEQLCEALREEYGIEAIFVQTDVSDMQACVHAAAEAAARFGQIDILVSNAGVCRLGGFLEASEEESRLSPRCQRQGRMEHLPCGVAIYEGAPIRQSDHHELGDRLYGGRSRRSRLCDEQGGADRADQGAGA